MVFLLKRQGELKGAAWLLLLGLEESLGVVGGLRWWPWHRIAGCCMGVVVNGEKQQRLVAAWWCFDATPGDGWVTAVRSGRCVKRLCEDGGGVEVVWCWCFGDRLKKMMMVRREVDGDDVERGRKK
ncbi:hypothetical protein Droror1_Dr00002332 [Drosera rotundifolia]